MPEWLLPERRGVAGVRLGGTAGWPGLSVVADADVADLLPVFMGDVVDGLDPVEGDFAIGLRGAGGISCPDAQGGHDGIIGNPLILAEPDWQVDARWQAGQVMAADSGGHRWFFDPFTQTVCRQHGAEGEVWFAQRGEMPAWARAAPGLRMVDWWGVRHGVLATHGAAVAFGDCGVVLLGPGGAGKSTLALGAVADGAAYLGDDYVALRRDADGGTRALGLFRSAKVAAGGDLSGLGRLLGRGAVPGDKDVWLIDAARCRAQVGIGAVVLPQIADVASPVVEAVSAAQVIRHVAPSILWQLRGDEAAKLRLMRATLADMPCYRLHLCRDTARNVSALRELAALHDVVGASVQDLADA
ncbi:hypothetical protein GTZ99_15310 [Novosphingobium sp. FSY-8]|uniref:Hpr(Ser) kinase/phosphatase n=1 Tax=Novosphingobium ovatum TaxID=1908523 RepID=A0ABW9XHN1_9SPHN|nr:hypothetical protein [Novosphingobium ovatum]NBC37922.1 hypothetical protein [Novosphingobium ovatum]